MQWRNRNPILLAIMRSKQKQLRISFVEYRKMIP